MKHKLIYFHGLNSTLHKDRYNELKKYPIEILSPLLDYEKKGSTIIHEIMEDYLPPSFIIGSSAGGLLGYYLSNIWEVPCLLFNPAMPYRESLPNLPKLKKRTHYTQIIIGAQDEIIPSQKSFELINSDCQKSDPIEIHWRNNMGHPLPIEIFREECSYFFSKVLK